jgi:putative transposase
MSQYIHKSHNVSVLLYHVVCPAKYRRVVFTEEVDKVVREVCEEISKRYEIEFLEIGVDKDHVHFLIQSVPRYSPSRIAQTVKSITAREVFRRVPSVKKQLWGGEFWTKGYFVNTVGQQGNEASIARYVKNQGREKEYQVVHRKQLSLFD